MENERNQTFNDLIEYAREKEYSLVETYKIYQILSRPVYLEEIENGNTQDIFQTNTKTESRLIEICKEEINKNLSKKTNQNP